jgi:N-acylneuraminate cytidylyltransferase
MCAIAFVPVRGGSKSIPLKNIKSFCGKPLVYWVVEALQNSKNIEKVFVATDSDAIKMVVRNFGFSKVEIYDRDPENARDTSSTESVMLEFIAKKNFKDEQIFILAQATNPFTQTEDIDAAIMKFTVEKADSLLTCVRVKKFFWGDGGIPLNYDCFNRPRRQDFRGILMENGAFYISRIGNIKKSQNRLSGKIVIYEMKEFSSVEIDEEDDWIIAEQLMHKHILSKRRKPNIKLFFSDVDGTLTDGGMYYSANGEELKKFNAQDGKGFELLRNAGIKVGIITSELTEIVQRRAQKLKLNYVYQGVSGEQKLKKIEEICKKEGITLQEVAYIGDDVNCKELLKSVGLAACPSNAVSEIKNIPNIIKLSKRGGCGAVREFVDLILENYIQITKK